MLAVNTLLQNRYLVTQPIGQGGMGAVYLAIDQRLGHAVALKETLFTGREDLTKAFAREARLLARLRHPALPSVSDHFSEEGRQFLVMEYIAGDDLSALLVKNGQPFDVVRVLVWADSLLDALEYLHSHEPPIIHRDIKPQNLKLTARDQIILLDFGLAKGHAGDVSRLSAAPLSLYGYTPRYAPLEQIKGTGTEARSDLYSLAATLYHLMTGIAPPDALSRVEAVVENRPDPLRRADEINAQISPAVATLLEHAMRLNRDERFASAHAMRAELREVAGADIEAARSVSLSNPLAVAESFAPTELTASAGEASNAPNLATVPFTSSPSRAENERPVARQTAPSSPAQTSPLIVADETATLVRASSTHGGGRAIMYGLLGVAALLCALGAGIYFSSGTNEQPAANTPVNNTSNEAMTDAPSPSPEEESEIAGEDGALGEMEAGLNQMQTRRNELMTGDAAGESRQVQELNQQITRLEQQIRALRERLDTRPARSSSDSSSERRTAATNNANRTTNRRPAAPTPTPRPRPTPYRVNDRRDADARRERRPPPDYDAIEERRRRNRERRRRTRGLRDDLGQSPVP